MQLHAVPASLAVLGVQDSRVVSNLVTRNASGSRGDGSDTWLAPLAWTVIPATTSSQTTGRMHNRIFTLLHEPAAISAITLVNYRKTPSRGVRGFSVFLDGALVFSGSLNQVGEHTELSVEACIKRHKHTSAIRACTHTQLVFHDISLHPALNR